MNKKDVLKSLRINHVFSLLAVLVVIAAFETGMLAKGVLVTATMALILSPACFAVLFTLFLIILAISRYVSLGSITVASLFPVCVCLYIVFVCQASLPILTVISTVFLGGFIVWCHRSNIGRLLKGNEKKFSIGKKESK